MVSRTEANEPHNDAGTINLSNEDRFDNFADELKGIAAERDDLVRAGAMAKLYSIPTDRQSLGKWYLDSKRLRNVDCWPSHTESDFDEIAGMAIGNLEPRGLFPKKTLKFPQFMGTDEGEEGNESESDSSADGWQINDYGTDMSSDKESQDGSSEVESDWSDASSDSPAESPRGDSSTSLIPASSSPVPFYPIASRRVKGHQPVSRIARGSEGIGSRDGDLLRVAPAPKL